MNTFGEGLKALALVIVAGSGLWSLFLCLKVFPSVDSSAPMLIGLLFEPMAFDAASLYAGISYGEWLPLYINYGGSLLGVALLGIGHALSTR